MLAYLHGKDKTNIVQAVDKSTCEPEITYVQKQKNSEEMLLFK